MPEDLDQRLAADDDRVIPVLLVGLDDGRAETLSKIGEDDQNLWAAAAILSWSFIRPSMTLSGRGGQPGM